MEHFSMIFTYIIGLITSITVPILRDYLFIRPKVRKEFIKELEYNLDGLEKFNKQLHNGIDIPNGADFVASPPSWPIFYISTNFFDEYKKEIYKITEIKDLTIIGILYERLHSLKALFAKAIEKSEDDCFTIGNTIKIIKPGLKSNDIHAMADIKYLLQRYKKQRFSSMSVLLRKFKHTIKNNQYIKKITL